MSKGSVITSHRPKPIHLFVIIHVQKLKYKQQLKITFASQTPNICQIILIQINKWCNFLHYSKFNLKKIIVHINFSMPLRPKSIHCVAGKVWKLKSLHQTLYSSMHKFEKHQCKASLCLVYNILGLGSRLTFFVFVCFPVIFYSLSNIFQMDGLDLSQQRY